MPKTPEKQEPGKKKNPSRWVKGQSGNPKGRTKGVVTLTEMLREYGEKEITTGGETLQAKEHLAKIVYQAIIDGFRIVDGKKVQLSDVVWSNCLSWLFDRVDGKANENVTIHKPEVEVSSEDYKDAMRGLAEWKKQCAKQKSSD